MAKIPHRLNLTEDQLPKQWYNMRADMKEQPEPMLNPVTHKPIKTEELYPIFCEELAAQEMDSTTRYIDIPEEVQEIYKCYRPSPLCRAYTLEKYLDTPARIYYKFEGNNTSGSHNLNSAVPQAYYAKKQGLKGLTTETGAGQWGTALAEACAYFGADVIASPSDTTAVGRAILAGDPNTTGSLGCAISEAIEVATTHEGYRYVLGSVLNQVVLHQSIIGLESKMAMEMLDEYPDIVIGCAGGGSNLAGLIAPFMQDKLLGRANPHFIAVEPASCPSLTRGKYAYDYCDTGKVTPLAKMYTLGCGFIPSANHAGGLRYHGMSPILSKLYHDGYLDEARAVEQTKVFEAATLFAKTETILPAPESSHAIRVAIDEALRCKETGESKCILFGLTGTGYFDMTAYTSFREGTMTDYIPTDEDLAPGFDSLPKIEEE